MASMISELTLSRIWHEGRHAREMRTTDGTRLEVIYAGVWSHSDGPDFRDALVSIGGQLHRGSVELHLRASDWQRHGHQTNREYDDVILHVVLEDDLDEPVHDSTGRQIRTVGLRSFLSGTLEDLAAAAFTSDLGSIGQRTCLPTLAGGREGAIRDVLRRAGWQRMVEKQLRYGQELERYPPGEVLYRGLLDGLGLTHNRDGMARVAERLPLALIEAAVADHGAHAAASALLGVGGFLPLADAHAHLADIDTTNADMLNSSFRRIAPQYGLEPLPAVTWILNRVRPLNHPVRRLASLGSLIGCAPSATLLDGCILAGRSGSHGWRRWLESATPSIGRSRSEQITVNVLAPMTAAYADAIGDRELEDAVSALWDQLPGSVDDAVSRSTARQIFGGARFAVRTAIEVQGLHHIGRRGCRELRCFECAIAALAVHYEPSHFS